MKLIVAITRGMIRDMRTRRKTMFVLLVIALLMLFAGTTFLESILRGSLLRFVIYWAVCAWLTICAALLAIFDLLMLRADGARARRNLKTRIFGNEKDDGKL